MSAFSRIQLAAALLEYDDDPDDQDAPKRSAYESAIFLPIRQNAESRSFIPRTNDHVRAGEGASQIAPTLSSSALALEHRQSRGSISILQNPFGPDDHLDEEDEDEEAEEELEVDLASWGLDAFMSKDKSSKKRNGRPTDSTVPHSVLSVPSRLPSTSRDAMVPIPRRALGASRSMSLGGNLEYFGSEFGERLPGPKVDSNRRRSMGSPMNATYSDQSHIWQRRRASSYSIARPTSLVPSQLVPFPVTSIVAGLENTSDLLHPSEPSRPQSTRERTHSAASLDSKLLFRDITEKRERTMSNATMATILLAEDNPFAIRPPSRASRFDPKAAAHARTVSNTSMGSRMPLDHDKMSVHTTQNPDAHERRYSTTLELLRPKVLVMPSPLQPAAAPSAPPENIRDGFELSTGGPPLPPGARSSRLSTVLGAPPLHASNSFTPNPLSSLSLSQITFRNSLRTGGYQDPHAELSLPRAIVDGEQAQFETEAENAPIIAIADDNYEIPKTARPAGKLFGKSLIDDLERRKAEMRNKQRVFTGDERPSMMARGSNRDSSTLIDSAAVQSRVVSQHIPPSGVRDAHHTLGRRNSKNSKPLLNFDEDQKAPGLSAGRSVFGIDTLWEKEMIKLREIEARERKEEEERKVREGMEGEKTKKKKKKDKTNTISAPETLSTHAKVSIEPPVLPDIPRADKKPVRQVSDDTSETDKSDDVDSSVQNAHSYDPNWHAASSDEETSSPRRTTGTGPRYPNRSRHRSTKAHSGSEDDLPLSVALNHAGRQHTLRPERDADDERPLSTLLLAKRAGSPARDFGNLLSKDHGGDDEDNQPLGLRVSRVAPSLHAALQSEDDDNRPLAFHPEQQRRSQLHMMQQQLMMQTQLQNSIYFSPPSMMAPPFFGAPMMPAMAQPPIPAPSPPLIHDQANISRVENWRRGVAVDGEP